MRKNQTLLIAGILLLATAVAVQAQGIYDVRGIRAMAREGGAAELAGRRGAFLERGERVALGGMVTVQYSAPLAEDTTPMVMRGRAKSD